MDQSLIASIRKSLEDTSTHELRQAYERGDRAAKSPEEFEAIRQTLEERRSKGNRAMLAIVSAILFGSFAAAGAWWQGIADAMIVLVGVVGAVLGFASWYVADLIPRA